MSHKQQYIAGDQIRPINRAASVSADTSDDLFRGSHICGKTGRRQTYINGVLHAWDGRAWRAVDSVRVADAISRMPAGQGRIDALRAALDQQNRDALARSGLDDPTEAAIAQSMSAVERANALVVSGENPQRDEYLRMVREANARALKMTGVQK